VLTQDCKLMDSTESGYRKICSVLYWYSVWHEGYS